MDRQPELDFIDSLIAVARHLKISINHVDNDLWTYTETAWTIQILDNFITVLSQIRLRLTQEA